MPMTLKLLRQVYGWSQTEAGKRCGISASLYHRYEMGKIEPTLSNLIKMSRGFQVDLDTLAGLKPLRVVPSEENQSKPA